MPLNASNAFFGQNSTFNGLSGCFARYLLAFCVVTCIVNSINCAWAAVAGHFVSPWLYNIGTTVLNGGVSMVVFFIVNKIVFNNKEANCENSEPLFQAQ